MPPAENSPCLRIWIRYRQRYAYFEALGAHRATDLDQRLRESAVDTVILAGISTSGVVLSTVRDASDRDYRVVVLADATADPEPHMHEFLIERIFPRQADVITVAQLDALLTAS